MGSMVVRCRLAARGGGLKLLSLSFHTEPVGGLDKFVSGHPGDQITRGSGPLSYFASVILHRRALVIKSYVTAIVNGLSCDRRVASRHEKLSAYPSQHGGRCISFEAHKLCRAVEVSRGWQGQLWCVWHAR